MLPLQWCSLKKNKNANCHCILVLATNALIELQAHLKRNVKQNLVVDDVYVQEYGGVEYLLWGKEWLITMKNSFLKV